MGGSTNYLRWTTPPTNKCARSDVTLEISAGRVPYFEEAIKLARQQIHTSAYLRNQSYIANRVTFEPNVPVEMRYILMDSETSGGLLIALPELNAGSALAALRDSGYPESAVIGRVLPLTETQIHIC